MKRTHTCTVVKHSRNHTSVFICTLLYVCLISLENLVTVQYARTQKSVETKFTEYVHPVEKDDSIVHDLWLYKFTQT